jgi:hypothetical protein
MKMANDHIADDRKKVRLIDATDENIKAILEKVPYYPDEIWKFTAMTKRFPTVDAAPVVHAHWEDGCAIHNGKEVYKSIDCSHCNEIFKTEDREYWKKRFKVCPFCGAIMDGERRTE